MRRIKGPLKRPGAIPYRKRRTVGTGRTSPRLPAEAHHHYGGNTDKNSQLAIDLFTTMLDTVKNMCLVF